jgi:hypothetical protein
MSSRTRRISDTSAAASRPLRPLLLLLLVARLLLLLLLYMLLLPLTRVCSRHKLNKVCSAG